MEQRFTNWSCLLQGNEAQHVLLCIKKIENYLIENLNYKSHCGTTHAIHLAGGTAGIALFFAYLQAAGLSSHSGTAIEYLDISMRGIADEPMEPSLYAGFTGIGWALEHIEKLLGISLENDSSEIEKAVNVYVDRTPWSDQYDLVNGLVGIGIYSLERNASPLSNRSLAIIVERLAELAEHSESGISWFHRPKLFVTDEQRSSYPNGYYNLGVAHGISGVIAFLSWVYDVGIQREIIATLVGPACDWLLKHHLPFGSCSIYPGLIKPGEQPVDCRLAWCHGDAGMSAALLLAVRLMGMSNREDEALLPGLKAATRDSVTADVEDASFCHGSSGLAHIFNRLYHATGRTEFENSARFWLNKTLEFYDATGEITGFSSWLPDENGKKTLTQDSGLLNGIAGIGLALLAFVTKLKPDWDRVFLIDIPIMSSHSNA